jgi:hypothetical protein
VSQSEKTFQRLPQYQGLFYAPCCKGGSKKHPCPDCHFCQECSPSRCQVCKGTGRKSEDKLSLREQIALYDKINSEK